VWLESKKEKRLETECLCCQEEGKQNHWKGGKLANQVADENRCHVEEERNEDLLVMAVPYLIANQ